MNLIKLPQDIIWENAKKRKLKCVTSLYNEEILSKAGPKENDTFFYLISENVEFKNQTFWEKFFGKTREFVNPVQIYASVIIYQEKPTVIDVYGEENVRILKKIFSSFKQDVIMRLARYDSYILKYEAFIGITYDSHY